MAVVIKKMQEWHVVLWDNRAEVVRHELCVCGVVITAALQADAVIAYRRRMGLEDDGLSVVVVEETRTVTAVEG